MLADVSPEYYAKIERGHLAGVSDAVLEAVARALQLDDAEREHLFDLARAANGAAQPVRRRRPKTWVAQGEPDPGAGRHRLTGPRSCATAGWTSSPPTRSAAPSTTRSSTGPGRATWRGSASSTSGPRRSIPDWEARRRHHRVDPADRGWPRPPRQAAARPRSGSCPPARDAFRTRWGAHNVRRHGSGTKVFVHHDVGEVTLTYEGMELTAEPGLSFLIYTAEPGSPSQERLQLPWRSLAADLHRRQRAPHPDTRPQTTTKEADHAHQDTRTGPRGLRDRARRDGHVPELRPQPRRAATT